MLRIENVIRTVVITAGGSRRIITQYVRVDGRVKLITGMGETLAEALQNAAEAAQAAGWPVINE